jgi:O-antigen/teichoic acid export membrane protein
MSAHEVEPQRRRSLRARVVDLGMARIGPLVARSVLFVIFARALTSAAYGDVAVMLAVANLFLALLDFGLPLLLLRAGAIGAPSAERAMTGLVVVRGVALVPVLALYAATLRAVVGSDLDLSLAIAVGLYTFVFQLAQTIFAFQRGARRTSREGITTGFVSLADVVLIIGWYAMGMRDPLWLFWLLAAIRVGAVIAVTLLSAPALRASLDLSATRSFLRENRAGLGLYFLLGIAQFAIAQVGTIVLQLLASADDVGVYFGANRIAWIAYLPVELLLAAALPRFAGASSAQFRRVLLGLQRLSTIWTLAVIAATFGVPALMTDVALGRAEPTTVAVFSMMMGATAVSWLPPYALPLAMEGNPRPVVRAYVIAALASAIAHVLLVPRYAAIGAALASLISYVVLKLLIVPLLREREMLIIDGKHTAVPLLVAMAWMGAVRAFSMPPLAALLVLGALALAGVLWQFRPSTSMIEGE